jgi:hypothetical protein
MANTERYETVIRLNTEQAKGEIEKLTKKIEGLRKKRSLFLTSIMLSGIKRSWQRQSKTVTAKQIRICLINRYRAYRAPPTLGRALCLCPENDRRDGLKPVFYLPALTPLRT